MALGSLLWNLSCVCSSLVFLQRWGGSSTLDGMVQKWWILWVLFTCSIKKKKDWPGLLKTIIKIVKRTCKKVTFLVHVKMIEWRWMSSMCDMMYSDDHTVVFWHWVKEQLFIAPGGRFTCSQACTASLVNTHHFLHYNLKIIPYVCENNYRFWSTS